MQKHAAQACTCQGQAGEKLPLSSFEDLLPCAIQSQSARKSKWGNCDLSTIKLRFSEANPPAHFLFLAGSTLGLFRAGSTLNGSTFQIVLALGNQGRESRHVP